MSISEQQNTNILIDSQSNSHDALTDSLSNAINVQAVMRERTCTCQREHAWKQSHDSMMFY